MDSLTCENVLYWRALCEFVKAKGDEADEMLEQVLPDAATYADYLCGWVTRQIHWIIYSGLLL